MHSATPGCSPKAGYVYGSNCYQDQEKAQYFSTNSYSAVSSPSLVGGVVYFYKNGTKGVSASSASVTTALKFYSATSNVATPGVLITSKTASISSIIAAQTGTVTFFTYT